MPRASEACQCPAAGREADLAEAEAWYESRQAGLGDALLDEFLRTTGLISEHPKMYRAVSGKARLAMLRRSPYLIIYVEESSSIEVVAVMHAHRNPEIWKSRLR